MTMKTAILQNRRWVVLLLGAVVVGTIGAGLRWNRSRTIELPPRAGNVATILVTPFAVNGAGSEPWSGSGLAEEVRMALDADNTVAIRRSEPTVIRAALPPNGDDVMEIAAARRIGADYVLTGTIGRKERGSEIGLRLIRATDASTAWTGTFWRSQADFPSFAGDLAAAITEAIRAERDRDAREREPQSKSPRRTPH
jgi:TolB-like protein